MPRTALLCLGLTAGCLLSSAPAVAGKREQQLMQVIQKDVDLLNREVRDVRQAVEQQGQSIERVVEILGDDSSSRAQLAAFNANLESLLAEIRRLGTRFDGVEERLRTLEERTLAAPAAAGAEAYGSLPRAAGPGAGAGGPMAPAPTAADDARALYSQAYADYLREKYDLAIAAFREYLEAHPRSDMADNARYWIAMSYFNQRDFEGALSEFDRLLRDHPRAENRAEAMYRKGVALRDLNRLGQAVLVLNDVVVQHPGTEAARQAEARLKELSSGN